MHDGLMTKPFQEVSDVHEVVALTKLARGRVRELLAHIVRK
jgi:hypothetical protein